MYKLKSTKPVIEIDTDWIEKGKKCWVFNPMDDLIIFMKAKVIQFKPATYTPAASTVICELEASNKLEVPVLEVFQRNEFTSILTNLTDLQVINNPQILFQLNERFKQKKIFTFIGSNLLIINPYQLIPQCFDQQMIDHFYNAIFIKKMTYKDQEPHIYGMTSQILKNISSQNEDQVIIISGESGSGKTETNKYCLKYLTKVCQKFHQAKQEQVQDIQNKILNCNPLLEAFGNAKTIKNDNSSRFGKLTALKIHCKNFYIKEAFIRSYFLQKSRVTLKNANELNFHIFYYVIDGISPQERGKYHLLNTDNSAMTINHFYYTKTAELLDQYKNLKYFNEVVSSMRILGLNYHIQQIWRLVMGILHLGNLNFDQSTFSEEKGGSPCTVADTKNLKSISDLFGIVPSDLEKSIVYYKRKTSQEEFHSPQSKKKCQETRDSISKMVYESLFLWLIDKLNKTLSPVKSQQEPNFYYLKLLDIYGFEVFEQNGYEQLAVNYTNERLHQIYIRQVFKQQKQAFREEGIADALINLKFADNTGVIELIDLSPTSIYNLVDQSCTVETKDEVLLSNIKKTHIEKSPEYFPPEANKNLTRKSFIINHTPGPIEYNIAGFREKNKDFVRQDIIELLSYSTNSILNEMFKAQQKSLLENKVKRFLSQKLRQQINNLMSELEAGTHVHFVRCIKPNDYKEPFVFVPKMALNQIKYLGLLDTILLRRATYHIKMPYQNFYKLYAAIDFTNNYELDYRQKAQQLFKRHFMGRGIDYIFGSSKIFLKQDSKPMIDKIYSQKLKRIRQYSQLIQSYVKTSRQLPKYAAIKKKYDKLLILEVYILNFAFEVKRNSAARKLQRWWSTAINEHVNKRKRRNCITVQKYFRKFLYSLNYNATQNNIAVIEKYLHSHALSCIQEDVTRFKSEVMDSIIDQIWERAIRFKTNTINTYLFAMITRIKQKNHIEQIHRNYKSRMYKRVTKNLLVYLQSVLPIIIKEKRLEAIKCIQKTYRFSKIRKAFLQARKSAKIIQRSWRKYHSEKLENIRFYQKVFEKEIKNKQDSMKVANEVFYKSKKLKNNSIELLLGELQNTKPNKIFLFYYLLDYQLLVDTSLVYSENSWVNNYYTLFKDSLQRGNPLQMIALGQTHTLAATTNKIYSWGWNDFNQLGINDKSVGSNVINPLNLPLIAKPKSIKAFNSYSSISFSQPPCIHYFGKIEEDRELLNIQFSSTITKKYSVINGHVHQIINKLYKEIPLTEKISSISCGALHVVAKSHLKRMFSWGNNDKGQLGHGDYLNKETPTPLVFQFDTKQNKPIQISAGHSSTLILFSNHRLYWCGTTSKIQKVNIPIEVEFDKQSGFVWDSTRFTPVRISSTWSRMMSVHGVTFAFHHGVLATNISLKKKVLSMLANKWSETEHNNLIPPYVASIARYFTQKTMRMPNYKPETEMESRKKLKELKEAIEIELNSFKVTNSQDTSQAYNDKLEEFE